jgi:pilus assembly protein CpaF
MTTPTTHTDDNFFAQLRMAQQATGETQEQVIRRIIAAVQDDVGKRPDLAMGAKSGDQLARKSVRDITLRFIQAHNDRAISDGGVRLTEVEDIVNRVMDIVIGLGPLEALLRMPGIEDIAINGPSESLVFKDGRWQATNVTFESAERLIELVNRAMSDTGRQVNVVQPLCDSRLPNLSRINVAIAPVADPSPLVTIRVFRDRVLEMNDWVRKPKLPSDRQEPPPPPTIHDYRDLGWDGPLTPQAAAFLEMATVADLNILVVGATGSGKTTLVQTLGRLKPPDRRMVVIEDTRELRIREQSNGLPNNCVYLTTRTSTVEGVAQEVLQAHLVKNALRMRPDGLTLGEARGAEMLDLLMALNTGHKGALTTLHANSIREVPGRISQMLQLADLKMPLSDQAVARWIAGAFHLAVFIELDHVARQRRITEIVEFNGAVEGTLPLSQPLFSFERGRLRRSLAPMTRAHLLERIGRSYQDIMGMDVLAPK